MKKILSLLIVILLLYPSSVSAQNKNTIEMATDGYYYETTIETSDIQLYANTKSGKKTVNYKNTAGQVMWSLTISGTFTYNSSSATCTVASVNANSNTSIWRIKSKSARKSGNSSIGEAVAQKYANGVVVQTLSKTVTLTCDKNGKLS